MSVLKFKLGLYTSEVILAMVKPYVTLVYVEVVKSTWPGEGAFSAPCGVLPPHKKRLHLVMQNLAYNSSYTSMHFR